MYALYSLQKVLAVFALSVELAALMCKWEKSGGGGVLLL
jgi:hypothetical protein